MGKITVSQWTLEEGTVSIYKYLLPDDIVHSCWLYVAQRVDWFHNKSVAHDTKIYTIMKIVGLKETYNPTLERYKSVE